MAVNLAPSDGNNPAIDSRAARSENGNTMALPAFTEIEREFANLSPEAQLTLLERLVHRIRAAVSGNRGTFESQLSAMAGDPEVQSELHKIDAEFAITEADGLESH